MTREADANAAAYLLSADTGGTFTDLVLTSVDGSQTIRHKVLSTPHDPAEAVMDGVRWLLENARVGPGSVTRVVHATTLGSNLILENRGRPVAYVTTRGFADVPFIGRDFRGPDKRYDMFYQKPVPPIATDQVHEVDERVDAQGSILLALKPDQVQEIGARLASDHVSAVAVCLLNSYANRAHEEAIASMLRELLPQAHVAASYEISPEFREFDRAITTIMSAHVAPEIVGYIASIARQLQELGIEAPLQVMQSNGGIVSANEVGRRAIHSVESGPAAGVMAARALARSVHAANVVALDMGGTTAKAALVIGGEPILTKEYRIGGDGHSGATKGGDGFKVRMPAIDLVEVGAGGGSIASVDAAGVLHVGPRSAGAAPGPACYSLGGEEPTVTDADLVLGYLDPEYFLGGSMALSIEKARAAIESRICAPTGLDVLEAAAGIHAVVNANMAAAIRLLTVERGIDPRDFVLVASGGAAPTHVVRIAEQFGIGSILVPAMAGVLSAVGLLTCDFEVDHSRTFVFDLDQPDPGELQRAFAGLIDLGLSDLRKQGVDLRKDIEIRRSIDLRYRAQTHELTIPIHNARLSRTALAQIKRDFYTAYQQRFGSATQARVESISLRVRLIARVPKMSFPEFPIRRQRRNLPRGFHDVYFRSERGPERTPIYLRTNLEPGQTIVGPAVIQAEDSSTVLPPSYRALVDERLNLVITSRASRSSGLTAQ